MLITCALVTWEDQSHGNAMLPPPFSHCIQRPHRKWNSGQQNTSSHRSLRRYTNNYEQIKLRRFGHVIRSSGLCKKVVQGTVPWIRKRGRQKKRWEDNIREWIDVRFQQQSESSRRPSEMAEDCRRCQQWCPYHPDGSVTQHISIPPVYYANGRS